MVAVCAIVVGGERSVVKQSGSTNKCHACVELRPPLPVYGSSFTLAEKRATQESNTNPDAKQ